MADGTHWPIVRWFRLWVSFSLSFFLFFLSFFLPLSLCLSICVPAYLLIYHSIFCCPSIYWDVRIDSHGLCVPSCWSCFYEAAFTQLGGSAPHVSGAALSFSPPSHMRSVCGYIVLEYWSLFCWTGIKIHHFIRAPAGHPPEEVGHYLVAAVDLTNTNAINLNG